MIWSMAQSVIKSRYAPTALGILWTLISPLVTVFVYWFVFSVGFRVQHRENIPFVVVFLSGLIPWMMLAETLTLNVTAITGNSHLVKKTIFPTEILPVVNLVVSLINHAFMMAVFIVLLIANRIAFHPFNFQFFYYLAALCFFSLALSFFFSAINVFYRDTAPLLTVALQLWFWLTPIVWVLDIIPDRFKLFITLNPMYYIVEGYRFAFIDHVPLFAHAGLDIYFWFVCLVLMAAGGWIFRRLKPSFADVV